MHLTRNGLPLRDYLQAARVDSALDRVGQPAFQVWMLRAARLAFSRQPRRDRGPARDRKHWWTDPLVAATAADAPAVRRSRALFAAIDEECRRQGTKLCVLVVGPVANYKAKNGQQPARADPGELGPRHPGHRRRDQGASATPDYQQLIFPLDGHLNQGGHDFLAREAAPALEAVIASTEQASRR